MLIIKMKNDNGNDKIMKESDINKKLFGNMLS